MEKQSLENFCPHITKAKEAMLRKQFAETKMVDVYEVVKLVSDETLELQLLDVSSDGELYIFILPGNNIAVPRLSGFSDPNSCEYVHIRDQLCPLEICSKKSKSKKHTLVSKGVSMCLHIMIGI